MTQKTEIQRRKEALKWLSIVRQATVDPETSAAYQTGLVDVPADVVEQACRDIGYQSRGQYEPTWPELGTIRERCHAIIRVQRERIESRRLLNRHIPDPVPQERVDDFMAQIRQAIGKKVMR